MQSPVVKDLVLIGGGHAHALVIRMWAMKPVAGLRLTLISPQVHTPYSGMLPGLVAGHYRFEQTHIDLVRLCAWAKVRFIQASAHAINAEQQTISLSERPDIGYDVCSLDIGSTPQLGIKGAPEFAVPVKPISRFYHHWQALQKRLLAHQHASPLKVAIIGGGAGGIELITAMQHWAQKHRCAAQFCLLSRAEKLLPDAPSSVQKNVMRHLAQNNIALHLGFDTQAIDATHIHCPQQKVAYDAAFYCTQASAADWLQQSSLDLTRDGFVEVNDKLQSSSHENVFAAGDIAHHVSQPTPKAGVYAVRAAPVLFHNLINYALNKPLKSFKPQRHFLSLLALGGKRALGSRPPLAFSGKWVWRWKDRIDVKFMTLFNELAPMMKRQMPAQLPEHLQHAMGIKDIHELAMRCGGCGGKVGASVLSEVLNQLRPIEHAGVVLGLKSPDDAAVLHIPDGQKLVQTIDHLKTLIDDPYLFGKLSALHALSDAFAMNASPHSAQALVQLPLAQETIQGRDMLQLMSGALEVLNAHSCALVGGHTSEDSQLNLGFCINALAQEKDLLHKQGASLGQVLILTQPLGTGALFAAHMRGQAHGDDIHGALTYMLQSNQAAAQIFHRANASACTDVTGFGLLGHLVEMLKGTELGARLHMDSIPPLRGCLEVMAAGIFSSLQPQNARLRRAIYNQDTFVDHPKYPLLFDPQTCGGLLATVNAEDAHDCLMALKAKGFSEACIIGEIVTADTPAMVTLDRGLHVEVHQKDSQPDT